MRCSLRDLGLVVVLLLTGACSPGASGPTPASDLRPPVHAVADRSRCVAVTRCTSSRMCPGQLCDAALGYCVDCVMDVDCPMGLVCRASACVTPPRPCRSSRECSDINQVCSTALGHCVDCAADTDCL